MFVESQRCTYRAPIRYVTKTWSVVLLNKKIHILLSQVYCLWWVVKTPTIISNNPVHAFYCSAYSAHCESEMGANVPGFHLVPLPFVVIQGGTGFKFRSKDRPPWLTSVILSQSPQSNIRHCFKLRHYHFLKHCSVFVSQQSLFIPTSLKDAHSFVQQRHEHDDTGLETLLKLHSCPNDRSLTGRGRWCQYETKIHHPRGLWCQCTVIKNSVNPAYSGTAMDLFFYSAASRFSLIQVISICILGTIYVFS